MILESFQEPYTESPVPRTISEYSNSKALPFSPPRASPPLYAQVVAGVPPTLLYRQGHGRVPGRVPRRVRTEAAGGKGT